jgi:hypothetical protein
MRCKHVAAAITPLHRFGSDTTGSGGAAFQSVLEHLRRYRLVYGCRGPGFRPEQRSM